MDSDYTVALDNDEQQKTQIEDSSIEPETNDVETVIEAKPTMKQTEPYTDKIDVLKAKTDKKYIIIPSEAYQKVKDLTDRIGELTEEDVEKYLSDNDRIALDVAVNGLPNTSPKGAFENKIDKTTWSQNLKVEDKEIKIRELKIRTDSLQGVLTGSRALAKLNVFLGLSNEIQIPLFHSGFHLTLDTLSEADIVDLSLRLAKKKIELGKNTNGLVFSNDSVLFSSIILDFVLEHMSSTTLMLSDEDDIRDYIKAPDIYLLTLGVIRSMEPNGFKISRTCKNAIQVDKNVKPMCNFTLSATLDVEEITYVDKDNMLEFHKRLNTKRSNNSVTKEEVIEYQKTLDVLKPKDIVINDNIILTLQVPNILDNINAGEMWIEDIESSVELQLSNIDEVTDEKRMVLLQRMSKATLLNRYLHYVKSITLGDARIEDVPTIYEALNAMVSTDDVYKQVSTALMEFVEENVISVIGITQYTCPTCQNTEDILEDSFKEVIPLNVYHTFLESCTLKVYEMEKRTEII